MAAAVTIRQRVQSKGLIADAVASIARQISVLNREFPELETYPIHPNRLLVITKAMLSGKVSPDDAKIAVNELVREVRRRLRSK